MSPGYVDPAVNIPSACAAWCTAGQISALGSRFDGLDAYSVQDAIWFSTDLLYVLTGRRWPGICEAVTVRPCAQNGSTDNIASWGHWDSSWGHCGCSSADSCGCAGRSKIGLGVYPIVAVSQVKVDGAVLAASRYRLDSDLPGEGWRWLTRLPDTGTDAEAWPCCQSLWLPDTADDTFSVTFTYGQAPPPGGVLAAAQLAGETARYLSGLDECSIGPGIRQMTRQGVSIDVVDPGGGAVEDLPQLARTFVRSVNPSGLTAEPTMWTPEGQSVIYPKP